MSGKEIKEMSRTISEKFGLSDFVNKKDKVELVDKRIITINDNPSFFYHEGELVPTLKLVLENKLLPENEQEKQDVIIYQATITSPQDDSAIRSNDGTLDIHVTTTPEKQNNQKLQLFLDGKRLGTPQISPTIRALNIDRGTHQVQVHLLDEEGKLLAKTQIVTVHLQRATVGTINASNGGK